MKEFEKNDIVHAHVDNVCNFLDDIIDGNPLSQYWEFVKNQNIDWNQFQEGKLLRIKNWGVVYLCKNIDDANVKAHRFYNILGDVDNKWYPGELFDKYYQENVPINNDPIAEANIQALPDFNDFKVKWGSITSEDVKKKEKQLDLPKLKFEICRLSYVTEEGVKQVYGYKLPTENAIIIENSNIKVVTSFYYQHIYNNNEAIMYLAKAKLTNYEASAKLFGYKPSKKAMFESGNQWKISDIKLGYTAKKTGEPVDIVELFDGKISLKFLMSDIELIWPDFKGFNIKKDRKITEGNYLKKDIRFVRTNKLPVEKNEKGKIVKMWNTHKPISGKSSSRRSVNYDENTKILVKTKDKEVICKIKNVKLIV